MRLQSALYIAAIALITLTPAGCNRSPTNIAAAPVSISNCSAPNVTIHKDGQVQWTGDGNITTLVFKKKPSPFAQGAYTLWDAKPQSSGPVNSAAQKCADVNGSCEYPYTVAESNGCTNDPIVIVTR